MSNALMEAARFGRCAELEQLLKTPNWQRRKDQVNAAGWTALFYAAIEGQAKAVRLLCEAGCDKDVQDPLTKTTALHWAAKTDKASTVAVLLKHGAKTNIKSKEGKVAEDLAGPEAKAVFTQFKRDGTVPEFAEKKSQEELLAEMEAAAEQARQARIDAEEAAARAASGAQAVAASNAQVAALQERAAANASAARANAQAAGGGDAQAQADALLSRAERSGVDASNRPAPAPRSPQAAAPAAVAAAEPEPVEEPGAGSPGNAKRKIIYQEQDPNKPKIAPGIAYGDGRADYPCTFGAKGVDYRCDLQAKISGACVCGWEKPAHYDRALAVKLGFDEKNLLEVQYEKVQLADRPCNRYQLNLDSAHEECEKCGHPKKAH